jgi:phosphoethanolamine N-methyltransferase
MSHTDEYHRNMVRMLELIWGEGYMAPGGPGNVARLLEGTNPAAKRILDIGCGIGGPAREMVTTHGANVVGIDLEAPLVARANADSATAGLTDRCAFMQVDPGPLPFDDESFDIVTSAGAVTQTDDKTSMFAEVFRVLRPCGHFRCYEWTDSGREYSEDMRYWFELEGLTYALVTQEYLGELLRSAGFESVETIDASDWYTAEARREYELIRGDLFETLVEQLGEEDANHFVEDWRMLANVCESRELLTGYCRAVKPATSRAGGAID